MKTKVSMSLGSFSLMLGFVLFATQQVHAADAECSQAGINQYLVKGIFRVATGSQVFTRGAVNYSSDVSLSRFDLSYGESVYFEATSNQGPAFTNRVAVSSWEIAFAGSLSKRISSLVLCDSSGILVSNEMHRTPEKLEVSVGHFSQNNEAPRQLTSKVLPAGDYSVIAVLDTGAKSVLRFKVLNAL